MKWMVKILKNYLKQFRNMDSSTASTIREIEELLPHSGIDSNRKMKLKRMIAQLSPDQLARVLVVLQKEREEMLKILRKVKTLDLKVDFLFQKFS